MIDDSGRISLKELDMNDVIENLEARCLECNNLLSFKHATRVKKFCNRSCCTKYTNKHRKYKKWTIEQKESRRILLKEHPEIIQKGINTRHENEEKGLTNRANYSNGQIKRYSKKEEIEKAKIIHRKIYDEEIKGNKVKEKISQGVKKNSLQLRDEGFYDIRTQKLRNNGTYDRMIEDLLQNPKYLNRKSKYKYTKVLG